MEFVQAIAMLVIINAITAFIILGAIWITSGRKNDKKLRK